jgi:hypothetical protein
MIVYKDMSFCAREGCPVKKCPRNPSHVDWSQELPVSVSDFWQKRSECPTKEPEMMPSFKEMLDRYK